jgi:Tfp pilus assembly protein PilF
MNQIFQEIISLENLIRLDPKNFINYFNLGNAYRKLGKYDLSLKNFNKSIELNKEFYQGYNNLANIYKELKNTKNSIKFFKKAIEINPTYISALYNLGIIYEDIGEYQESYICFEKILKIDSNHIAALNNFGLLLKNIKEYKKALKCFEKIIHLDVNFIKAYNNIGTISLELGDVKTAILNFKKVLKLNPESLISYQNLLAAYENSNQIENYQKTLKLSQKKFPDEDILIFYEGVLLFRKKNFLEAISQLNNLNFKNYDLEIKRNFFIARAYDGINNEDKAFKYFVKANELQKNTLEAKKFNKNRYLKNIEKRKNYFNEKNINKWRVINYPKPIINIAFLVGFPRSGTTLLDTILRSHPKIKIIEEKPMTLKMIDKIKNNDLHSLENITNQEIKNLQQEYLIEISKHINVEDKSNLYIDKLPLNLINAGEIIRIFPNAKFIFSLRHPLDCVLSCFMQNFNLNDAMINFLNIKDSSILYKETMELWNRYISLLKINYVSIKYEDLIKNLEDNIKPIIKFLNLNWDKSVLNYRNTALNREKISTPSYYQVIQPIYQNANQRWKRYQKYLSDIDPDLNKLIKKYKY